jgi:hypothetical protein
MQKLMLISCLLALGFFACKKKIVENNLVGEWKYEYRLLEDGTRDYQEPYALLGWNYSDGFILYEDGTGYSVWYDSINSDKFAWSNTRNLMTMQVTQPNNEIHEFDYTITEVKENSMFLEDVNKGNKYFMNKK